MSGNDETYLESFMETLTNLPLDLRRTMDLLKDLDMTCSGELRELRRLQTQYIQETEQKILQLPVTDLPDESDDEIHPFYRKRPANDDEMRQGISINGEAVIPTTNEFIEYTYSEMYPQIKKLQKSVLQKADEKVSVAQQAYDMIDSKVQRLDADLDSMERLLQATGAFQEAVTAQPDDLAACQVTPGSEWILAKVMQYDNNTGMYKLADEDVDSNKIFDLPSSQVIVVNPNPDLSKGDTVFAVYPDTTSFYQATVVQVPRKSGNFVLVNFVDDSDENGVTHDKAVPPHHVIKEEFLYK